MLWAAIFHVNHTKSKSVGTLGTLTWMTLADGFRCEEEHRSIFHIIAVAVCFCISIHFWGLRHPEFRVSSLKTRQISLDLILWKRGPARLRDLIYNVGMALLSRSKWPMRLLANWHITAVDIRYWPIYFVLILLAYKKIYRSLWLDEGSNPRNSIKKIQKYTHIQNKYFWKLEYGLYWKIL